MSYSFAIYGLLTMDNTGVVQKTMVGTDLNNYLFTVNSPLHLGNHAQTCVYTCRKWRAGEITGPYKFEWNENPVPPGERHIGTFGAGSPGDEILKQIEAEFAMGESVLLFIFDSNIDLCFQIVLEPTTNHSQP